MPSRTVRAASLQGHLELTALARFLLHPYLPFSGKELRHKQLECSSVGNSNAK